ncbi:MAG: trypsin-like peptidase domain-containing protein, partial [Planctomycetales bacterium]|nr:trypsin-like peptidase domain-containing protein [Planctomycetales bacterium]
LGLGVLVGMLAVAWRGQTPAYDPSAAPRTVTPAGNLADDEKATIDLFRNCSQSVVYITTVAVRRDRFNFNPVEIPRGTGSGFIWDEEGHIVTNFHVVSEATRQEDQIRVTLADQSTRRAEIIGVAPDNDLAVLRIEGGAASLPPIPVGASSDLQVGQKVLAIGNPFGLDQTLTTGVISGLGREITADNGRTIFDVIQTDAAINPGNSGGPLLDSSGRMIGVNTAIYSPSGAYAGIGFAIPVDTVNRVVPQLLRHGQVVRPGFGIQIANDQIGRQLGIEGVLVLEVQPDSAAAAAGFRSTSIDDQEQILLGDIVTAIDGQAIRTSDDLFKILDRRNVGDTVQVRLLRAARTAEEQQVDVPVTLKPLR